MATTLKVKVDTTELVKEALDRMDLDPIEKIQALVITKTTLFQEVLDETLDNDSRSNIPIEDIIEAIMIIIDLINRFFG